MDESVPEVKAGWERDVRKHIFVLSSAGKPIFSRFGDEQQLVSTFGLLQAVVAVVQDSGDNIRCIQAGRRRIVYFIRNSLYFVSVSSTGEPECVLSKQLEFLYQQILLVLTSKVHEILRDNSSKDLRDLLGYDTTRLMHASCETDLVPPSVAFEAVRSYSMDKTLREDLMDILQSCVDSSGAALGIFLYGEALIAYSLAKETPLVLEASDVILLTHFVGNSTSLRSHDQNWVPICLPGYNSGAFFQAYIGDIPVETVALRKTTLRPTSPILSSSGMPSMSFKRGPWRQFSLLLISPTSDASLFKDLHMGRQRLEEAVNSPGVAGRLLSSIDAREQRVSKFLPPSMCLHFFFKYRPSVPAVTSSSGKTVPLCPGQWVSSKFDFPLNTLESHSRFSCNGTAMMSFDCVYLVRTWTQYQRLALCVRRGSSLPECTLLPPVKEKQFPADPWDLYANKESSSSRQSPAEAVGGGGETGAGGGMRRNTFSSRMFPMSSAASTTAELTPTKEESNCNPLTLLPSSDHSLAYSVLPTGHVVVGLATAESEFYGTFPGPLNPVDTCGMASFLARTLKQEASQFFLTGVTR